MTLSIAALTLAVAMLAPPATTSVPLNGAFVHAGSVLDAAGWARLPAVTATATDPDGKSSTYGGIRLADVLRTAGVPLGDQLRGEPARAYVVVSAADHYAAVYSLGELDPAEARCAPLVADERDGGLFDAKTGPLRIVAPCDRTHARWVRQVTGVTVVVAPTP